MSDDPPHGSPNGELGAFVSGPLITRHAALFTDLYELTMAASYFREGMQVWLREPASYPVSYSDRLVGVQQALKAEIARHEKLEARTEAATGGRAVAGPEATLGPTVRIDGPGRR